MLRFCGVAFCRGYAPHGVFSPLRRPYSSASKPGSSQEELAKALGFSRSSGPGGQNVNKVNSKATLKVSLRDLLSFVPSALHAKIRASPYVTGKAENIVISSDDQRKQTANTESCFEKLADLIKDAGAKSIPGETSDETRERVTLLAETHKEFRIQSKKAHSSKKSARRGGNSRSDY